MTVEDEVEEVKMTSHKGVEHQVEDDKVGHIELSFSILPVAVSSDLIKQIDLDDLYQKDDDYVRHELLIQKSPART